MNMGTGITGRIDVKKIDKSRLYQGAKGTYLNFTFFLNDETDQYGNNGFITQEITKEEKNNGVKMPILGNVKIFYRENQNQNQGNQNQGNYQGQSQNQQATIPDSEIPF